MKKITLLLAMVICLGMFASCGSIDIEVKLKAKEGEPADGFVWENNFSEITITGYVGSSNDIVIPSKINDKPVTKIQAGAFSGFEALKSVKIPESVKIIDGAFKKCINLETVVLNEGLESMQNAFVGCSSLVSIEIPGSVKSINCAFEQCSSLESAVILNGVESMDESFRYCTSLKSINVPESVTEMSSAFYACENLKNVVLNASATELSLAFAGCSALEEIVIPDGVINLTSAFYGCSSLKSVDIPSSVKYLDHAFADCVSLENVTIPQGVTDLSESFINCKSLKSLIIPDSVTRIYRAINGCSGLEILVLPNTYTDEINLSGIYNLKSLTASKETAERLFDHRYKDEYTLCTETNESWYKELIKTGTNVGSYTYYPTELSDGSIYRKINKIGSKSVKSYKLDDQVNGNVTTTKEYYLAFPDDEAKDRIPAVICYTSVSEKCVSSYYFLMDVAYDERPGSISSEIEINGVKYSVK